MSELSLNERSKRLAKYIDTITGENDSESLLSGFALDTASLTGFSNHDLERATEAANLVLGGHVIDSEDAAIALERVIHLEGRPSRLIQEDWFDSFGGDFRYLTVRDRAKQAIRNTIRAVGRIDLPGRQGQDVYGGTGFIIGEHLVMTNRHVAEIFTSGVGIKRISIQPGFSSEIDMKREEDRPTGPKFPLLDCLMVHPYWDMAIFRADLPSDIAPLEFTTEETSELNGHDVVVVGYPSFSPGSNKQVREIFDQIDRVKRIAPGRIVERQLSISSTWLRRSIEAMAHDCSTLRGSSGSALLDVNSGLLAGLHFGGRYLIENYAVPGYELARDPYVIDSGVSFKGRTPEPNRELDPYWRNADPVGEVDDDYESSPVRRPTSHGRVNRRNNKISVDVPVTITVSIPDFQIKNEVAHSHKATGGYFETSATEATVEDYHGTAGAVDVGFWNIEWFTNRHQQKVGDVAELVDDLQLDIWCFQEASPRATERLVDRLNRHHDGTYDYLAAEPDSRDGKQSNTVIWNTDTISCEKESWGDLEYLFRLDSRDPRIDEIMGNTEAVHGKVFNRYPQIFKCTAENGYDFRVVPLHLKAMDEGSLRRRIASAILALAVNQKIEEGVDNDWIIGGDMNADLESGDFDKLTGDGFDAVSAQDEEDGGITYIKRPYKSLIDHIFLSPNLSSSHGADDFFIVARDLQNPRDFLRDLSDHRPVIVRLSLAESDNESADDSLVSALAKLKW